MSSPRWSTLANTAVVGIALQTASGRKSGDKGRQAQGRVNHGGGKVPTPIEAAVENVPMVTAPEEKEDDEPRYTAWLDLPISTREPMTAKDANEARKALLALDDRTPQQRLLGEPPTWRSALAQRNR